MPLSSTHADLARNVATSFGSVSSVSASGSLTAAASGAGEDPSLNNDVLLEDLRSKVAETYRAAATLTDEVYDKWTQDIAPYSKALQRLTNFVTRRLSVTINNGDSLTEFQKELLRVTLQSSKFALFLENEEHQSAYGPKQESLSDLKGRFQQVAYAARPLLEMSDSDLQGYVTTYTRHSLRVPQGIKRNVCAVALKFMTETFNSVSL